MGNGGILRISHRACCNGANSEICKNHYSLRISNRACSRGENMKTLCKMMRIMNFKSCLWPWGNRTILLNCCILRISIVQNCLVLRKIHRVVAVRKSYKSENCCLLRTWNRVWNRTKMKIVACISRENKELCGIKRNYKYRIVFLDVAERQEYYGDPSLITNKKNLWLWEIPSLSDSKIYCRRRRKIFASLVKLVRVCGWRERLANNFLVPSAFLWHQIWTGEKSWPFFFSKTANNFRPTHPPPPPPP